MILKVGILTTAFLLPLIGLVNGYGFELSKVIFFIFAVTSLGFCWVILDKDKLKIEWSSVSCASLVFLGVLFITALTGLSIKSSLIGNPPYFQGFILYVYLYLFYLLIKHHRIELKYWAYILTFSSFLVSLFAIRDYILLGFGQFIPTYAGRVISTFGQPNFYSGFILLTLPFLYFLIKEKYVGWILGLEVLIINLFGIWISGSRAALVLVAILLVFWVIKSMKFNKVILVEVLIITLVFSGGLIKKEIINPLSTIDPDLTTVGAEKRIYIFYLAETVILQNPVMGYGLENIDPAFKNFFSVNKHQLFEENLKVYPVWITLKDLLIDRTHNYPLDLLLFSGIAGLLAWACLIFLLLKKSRNGTLLVSLGLYLIWIQFQNQSIAHLVYFWLLAGLIDSKNI